MQSTDDDGQERIDRQEILRELPGFRLDRGEPCLCGVEAISTRTERAFSDSLVFHHTCTECGNYFSTWIEG